MNVNARHSSIGCLVVALLLSFLPLSSQAQQRFCQLAGRVIDAQQQPVAYTSVALYDGTLPVAGAVTDEQGRFSIKAKQSDKPHRLVAEFIGYKRHEAPLTPNASRIEVGSITLHEAAIALDEVAVTASQVAQKSTIEHTTLNASAQLAASKGTALDILRGASSVSISNDNVAIRGNSNILVLMDGIPTTASDLATIPAANIARIEVITNPDASHDAGGTGGIIHIVSRRTRTQGFSGMVSANYGFNHFANGHIALASNRPQSRWRFSYNSRYEDDVVRSTLHRHVHTTGYEVFQQMRATRYTFNNNLMLGADFNLHPRHRLSVDVKAMLPRLNIEQQLHNRFAQRQEQRFNDVSWNRENIDVSVAYTHIIQPQVSEISLRGSLSKTWGHRPSYYATEGVQTHRSESGGSPFIPALQADYKRQLKAGSLQAGARLTYRRNDIYHRFYERTEGHWSPSAEMSNDLLHTELVPAAYLLYASRPGRPFTYKAGLRGEFSTTTLDSHHQSVHQRSNRLFVAPSISGSYRLAAGQTVSMALSRRIGRPTYPQLNPYMSMVDATTYEQGNMHLKPERATKVDVSYQLTSQGVNLFVDGYLNHTTDYISQITRMDDERLITTYANADNDLKAGVELSLRLTPARWMNWSLGANTYYTTTRGTYQGAHIDNQGWTNNSNLMLNLLPWQGGDIQLHYLLTTPQYYPQLTTAFTHQLNIGIKQRLLRGGMTLSLLLTDALNTARWEVSSHNNLFDLRNSSRNKSQMVWLGVSYNFNAFKQQGQQKGETDRSLIKLGM